MKTDIAALQRPTRKNYDWSKAAWTDCDHCGESHTGTVLAQDGTRICAGCCDAEYYSAWEDLAERAIKLLEAERQQADDAMTSITDYLSDNIKVKAELAALKGEQVPFAYAYHRDTGVWWLSLEKPKLPGYTEVRELFTAPQKPIVLPEINEDLVEIIGRPNFTCSGLAELLRRNGADIKRKSENEQAYVIHWLLVIYLKHGIEWRAIAESELKSMAAKAAAGGIVKDGQS